MPRSRRQKLVSLTKTTSKGREGKEKLVENVQEAIEKYPHIWLFNVDNMRNTYLKDVRAHWAGRQGRIFFGRNRPIAKALGTTVEEEIKPGLSAIANKLRGDIGLFLTSAEPAEVEEYFSTFHKADYARSGVVASKTVILPAGQVMRGEDEMPPNMFEALRKLGMPVYKEVGHITLRSDYTICEEGRALTPDQAHLLKLFYHQIAEFTIQLKYHWFDGEFREL